MKIIILLIVIIIGLAFVIFCNPYRDDTKYSSKKEYKPIEYKLENPKFNDEEENTNTSFNPVPLDSEAEIVRQYEELIEQSRTTNNNSTTKIKTLKQYKSAYDYFLNTSEWLSCRNRILKRDKHSCLWCKSNDNLQVHHKYYCKLPNKQLVKPWEYKDDCFMTLCKDCHNKWHSEHTNKIYYRSWKDHQAILKEIKTYERA